MQNHGSSSETSLRCIVVTREEQLRDAFAVRMMAFAEDEGVPDRKLLDENDYVSTHVVMYRGAEPIGSCRLRWFAEFAKVERTCLVPAHRNTANLLFMADFVFAHVGQKGYRTLVTHAEKHFARLWVRFFGFEYNTGKPLFEPDGPKPLLELLRRIEPPRDAITLATPTEVMLSTEGAWNASVRLG